ncbi:MAG: transcriptional regulator [Rhodospirillaceae bacterium]|nr:transcriptional regulator [Rhodospirillaceae bacterium]
MPKFRFLLLVAVAATGLLAVTPARAAELLMFESAACEWCERWHEEIGPAYGKTRFGRIAPLRRIDIDRTVPAAYRAVRGVAYTPTFVLWHRGREIGRLVGYPGEDFFWPLLERLLDKLPAAQADPARRTKG